MSSVEKGCRAAHRAYFGEDTTIDVPFGVGKISLTEIFESGYVAGYEDGDRSSPPCARPGCPIESRHQHPKTRAEVDGDYARGVRAALELVDGRGFVSRKRIRNAITALLSQEVQP